MRLSCAAVRAVRRLSCLLPKRCQALRKSSQIRRNSVNGKVPTGLRKGESRVLELGIKAPRKGVGSGVGQPAAGWYVGCAGFRKGLLKWVDQRSGAKKRPASGSASAGARSELCGGYAPIVRGPDSPSPEPHPARPPGATP